MATILISFIKIFKLGPEVSLNGSPTVSPTTVALCTSPPFPPKLPSSTYFFALSHAPPALAIKIANTKPLLKPPISRPSTPGTPKINPVRIGAIIANPDGLTLRANEEADGIPKRNQNFILIITDSVWTNSRTSSLRGSLRIRELIINPSSSLPPFSTNR